MAWSHWLMAVAFVAGTSTVQAAGSAWRAIERERPADAAALPAPWHDALQRMSSAQLDALRAGAGAETIVLDGGGTLADFLATRGVVGVPAAVAAAPNGGGTSNGGGMAIEGSLSPLGGGIPDGSLRGGPFRLDPLLPGGGGTSTSAAFRIDATIGQPTVATAISAQTTLRPGFWTANGAAVVDRVFFNGFE